MMNRDMLFAALFALLLSWASTANAQARGTIVGTVTDSSGAVIAGARVSATQVSTQVVQTAVTSGSGVFAIPNLAVGTYNVQAEANGFRSASANGITLDVTQQRNIDFHLVLGSTEQSVRVTAEEPLLNSTNATLAGLVTQQQVESLPLNGRSIQGLVMLQPGMAQDPGSMGWLAPQWIGNGNRGETEEMTLDGADATDNEMGTVQFWNFNLDAIAEFKVLQGNYSAEFGQGGGTITQMVSKAGGNQFHGSAFEFIRNSVLDARNYFSTIVPPFQRNEFGATLGGPVIKGKIFFFVEYAGFRQLLGEPTIIPVPTAAERTGLITIGSNEYQVPLNSVAAGVLAKYPQPNQPNGLYGPSTLNTNFKQPYDTNQYSIRVDDHISDHDYLFGRATYVNNDQKDTDVVAALESPTYSDANFNDARNYVASETHTFTNQLINTAIFAVNRQLEGSQPRFQGYNYTSFADGSLSNWGPDVFSAKYRNTYYNPSDKLAWSKGRHLLNFGVEFRFGVDNAPYYIPPNGTYTFNSGTSLPEAIPSTTGGPTIAAGSPSPSGLVSMMEGAATTYNRSTNIPGFASSTSPDTPISVRYWHLATYFQDDYKVTPKLTLNLGLRYEYASVPYEVHNLLWRVADAGSLFGDVLVNPRPLYQPDRLNLAPRLGFALAATSRTVVRGGFAIFTNLIPGIYPDQTIGPTAENGTLINPVYSLTLQPTTVPPLESTAGAVLPPNGNTKQLAPNTPIDIAPLAALNGPLGAYWTSSKLKNGYTWTGNLTLEQRLPADMALQASAVTSTAMNLFNASYPNAYTGAETAYTVYTNVTPGLGEFVLMTNQGVSHYNALQVQARKISPLHGFQYQANYTWASLLADSDTVFSDYGPNSATSPNNPTCIRCEYGRANYDVRHRFVANFSYNIPGRWGFMPSALSNGWQMLGIFQAQTGFPFSVVEPYGTLAYGLDTLNAPYGGVRPFVGQQRVSKAPPGTPQFFSNDVINNVNTYFPSPQVFSSNLNSNVQTSPGNLGRNTFTGPSWWNADFSMMKNTQLLEHLNMQFRAEFFNIFNHAQFATPTSLIGNPSFGFSTSTANPERQIQFSLRLIF